jgi:hypothetical protein
MQNPRSSGNEESKKRGWKLVQTMKPGHLYSGSSLGVLIHG